MPDKRVQNTLVPVANHQNARVFVSAAIANAICNATGTRVRHYPITLDKLIGGLPDVA